MFQVAHRQQRQRHVDLDVRRASEPAGATVGKRTLTQEMTHGAPNWYQRAIESARRELRAVRSVALPAFIKTLRDKSLEAIAKQIQLAQAAMQVRHLLMTANQHVKALEKAATFRDPMVLFLRHDLDALAMRSAKLGVYQGAETMLPKAHVEETKVPTARGESAQAARKNTKTRHQPPAHLQTPVAKPAKPAPIAPAPRVRGSSTSVRETERRVAR